MRIALISDLHGNLVALDAVLAAARRAGVDRIVCLGDVATMGPRPREVIARVRELGTPAVLGNHDEFLLDPELIHRYTESAAVAASVDWCRAQLGDEELAFLRRLQRGFSLDLDGHGTLALFHGSPRSHMEDLLATTPAEALAAALGDAVGRATVMAGGHTHVQMLRQFRGTLVVNPGSVGMPFRAHIGEGRPTVLQHAEYAIVDGDATGLRVTLERVTVDTRAVRASIRGSGEPMESWLLSSWA